MRHPHCYYRKRHTMQSLLFSGLFLIIGGSLLILNSVFGYSIPLFRAFLALLFFYWGLSIIFGTRTTRNWHWNSVRGSYYYVKREASHIKITDEIIQNNTQGLAFETRKGRATIDLSALSAEGIRSAKVPLDIYSKTRSGETIFILNRTIPFEIRTESSHGLVEFPDGTTNIRGSYKYRSHHDQEPLITIFAEVRSGNIKCITQ